MKRLNLERRVFFTIQMFVFCALFVFIGTASAQLTATANHDHITVDFFYHGSSVSVRGVSDPDADLIIKVTSEDGDQVLRKRGKVGGFLWMNVGELEVEHVPTVYFLHSTKKIGDILSKEEMNKYVIGYPALENHVKMNVPRAEEDKWFNELVKYNEASDIYVTTTGKISLTQKNGVQNYYILTEWPYEAPPGNYTVTVYAVKDKKVVETATSHVAVEQVGLVKAFTNMAKNNGAVYGLISIIAALGAGFGVGLVFGKGGGAH